MAVHALPAAATSVSGCDSWRVIQGTRDGGDVSLGHVGVASGGADGTVAEQDLDDSDVGAGLEQVSGKGMTKRVHRHLRLMSSRCAREEAANTCGR